MLFRSGFRVGLCGTALPGGLGTNEGIRDVSSLAIRIPRVHEGAADGQGAHVICRLHREIFRMH